MAFDTASDRLSVSIRVDPALPTSEAADRSEPAFSDSTQSVDYSAELGYRHAETLLPTLQRLLAELSATPAEIAAVVCSAGPGSFTGLRIGYATAKGLCAASGASFITVSTLEAMAHSYSYYPGLVVPLLDARKKRLYAAAFSGGSRLHEDADLTGEELAALLARLSAERGTETLPALLVGSGSRLAESSLQRAGIAHIHAAAPLGSAYSLLTIGLQKLAAGVTEPDDAGPHYVRKSDAELANRRQPPSDR